MMDDRERGGAPDPLGRGRGPLGGDAAKFAGLGLQFAAAIIVFLFVGQWLDRRLGTSPLFLIVGVFVGAGGAFYSLYRRLMAEQEREERERKERR